MKLLSVRSCRSLLSCPMRYPGCGVWKTKCAARYAFHGARLQMYRMSCVPKDMIACSAVLYF